MNRLRQRNGDASLVEVMVMKKLIHEALMRGVILYPGCIDFWRTFKLLNSVEIVVAEHSRAVLFPLTF